MKYQLEYEEIMKELQEIKDTCESENRQPNLRKQKRGNELLDRCDELDVLMEHSAPDPQSKAKIDAIKADMLGGTRNMGRKNGHFKSF